MEPPSHPSMAREGGPTDTVIETLDDPGPQRSTSPADRTSRTARSDG
jgi:hypothetical protein